MTSIARINPAFEALSITVELDGTCIRAVVTREALEALTHVTVKDPEMMLSVFESNRHELEVEVLDRYFRTRKEPVVLHVEKPGAPGKASA